MSGGAERQEGAPPSLPPMQRAVPVHVPNLTSLEVARGKRTGLTRGPDERVVHFALLSRWKQISATLMHSTYVRDSFSHFDSRTINIERAINDLDPLLRTYASTNPMDNEARLTDLRDILRQGAKFAFLLFSQPCFWQFDWKEEVGKGKGTWAVAMGNGNPVVWPNLMRVMNEEGKRLEVPDVLGRKRFLRDGE
ncbi:hypothetical protein BU16DRAFT_521226 [Lophium mytilinum]|uniref:Uncharacterized protein n=1 Tax=Lophium mytilinum TaxID=390894 RepID=A0A6A6RD65_9PEZI|nr:hypothetical protein BU16DRAFT_521226 [Lophium mytilinum]